MADSKLKKVLIITYYWPPSGGAGVQRWLKTASYLREFGWEPVIFTPSNPEIPVQDDSLQRDVPPDLEIIKIPIWEPYSIYKKIVGLKSTDRINAGLLSTKKKSGFLQNFTVWLRGNLFIPDARKFWVKPATRYLRNYLKTNKVDAIVSTGPPHSMHIIARNLHSIVHIPWLADFRDPWTGIDYYQQLKIGKRADGLQHKMEKSVLGQATCISVVSQKMKTDFMKIVPREYHVVTNGFDEKDVPSINPTILSEKFIILHAGSITPTRNPVSLWKALEEMTKESKAFSSVLEIQFIGKFDHSVLKSLEEHNLTKYLKLTDYLPHNELIIQFYQASLLLLLINNVAGSEGIVTGKIFEYLASGRKILCIGPTDGDAASILEETGAGKTAGFDDIAGIKNLVNEFCQTRTVQQNPNIKQAISKYSRRTLTGSFALLLDSISKS